MTICYDSQPYTSLEEALNDPQAVCVLNVGGQNLSAVPKDINKLTNLETLYLHDNNLSDLPGELSALAKLTYIDLGKNKFTQIPEVVFELKNLQFFDFNSNILEIFLSNPIFF